MKLFQFRLPGINPVVLLINAALSLQESEAIALWAANKPVSTMKLIRRTSTVSFTDAPEKWHVPGRIRTCVMRPFERSRYLRPLDDGNDGPIARQPGLAEMTCRA